MHNHYYLSFPGTKTPSRKTKKSTVPAKAEPLLQVLTKLPWKKFHAGRSLRLRGAGKVLPFAVDAHERARAPKVPRGFTLEPRVDFEPLWAFPLEAEKSKVIPPLKPGQKWNLWTVHVEAGTEAVANVEVTLRVKHDRTNRERRLESVWTNKDGAVELYFGIEWIPVELIVEPAGRFWPQFLTEVADGMTVKLDPLPFDSPIGWWHERCGLTSRNVNQRRGAGIRVGMIDAGVTAHPHLPNVIRHGVIKPDGILAAAPPTPSRFDDHGTHVAGLIVARPGGDRGYVGFAPDCELHSVQVLGGDGRADQLRIAAAIDFLVQQDVHLINISLGAASRAFLPVLERAVNHAFERGTVCLCASGNEAAAELLIPAGIDAGLAIGALGLNESPFRPLDRMDRFEPDTNAKRDAANGVFVAHFSNAGELLDAGAPGVSIISTVTPRDNEAAPYAAFSGTSMAAPIACGVLAANLSATVATDDAPAFADRPPGRARAEAAVAVFEEFGTTLSFTAKNQPARLVKLKK